MFVRFNLFIFYFFLQLAKPIADWVGLRPARSEVRLEKEVMEIPDGRRLKVTRGVVW